MSERNIAALLAKKERLNTLNNSMHTGSVMESVIFDIENERINAEVHYELLEKEIHSSEFTSLSENEKIELFARFINSSKALSRSYKKGNLLGVDYKISQNNPKEITFGNQEHGFFVVINEQGIYSEICVNETNNYTKLKNYDFNIILNKKIYVVDGEINEYIEIYDQYLKEKSLKEFYDIIKPMCAEIVSKNPEYMLSSSELGFFRTEISPEEEIKNCTDLTAEILPAHSISDVTNEKLSYFEINNNDNKNYVRYSDLVEVAKKYNRNCFMVYNIIQSALNSEYILENVSNTTQGPRKKI